MRTLDDAFEMHGGYVLNFSDRTMREFFEDEFAIDIYQDKYSFNGTSKAKYLRAFVKVENEHVVLRVLRKLWEYRGTLSPEDLSPTRPPEQVQMIKERLFKLLEKIESSGAVPSTDGIEVFTQSETLEELVAAIERDIGANKPVAALDRLHTYCMKKFAHLLESRGIACESDEPLHSRVAKYVRALKGERELRDVTAQVIRNSIGIFEKFNYVRNNQSLAHDNTLLDPAEARFIYDSVTALLRFVKSVERAKFGA